MKTLPEYVRIVVIDDHCLSVVKTLPGSMSVLKASLELELYLSFILNFVQGTRENEGNVQLILNRSFFVMESNQETKEIIFY